MQDLNMHSPWHDPFYMDGESGVSSVACDVGQELIWAAGQGVSDYLSHQYQYLPRV